MEENIFLLLLFFCSPLNYYVVNVKTLHSCVSLKLLIARVNPAQQNLLSTVSC